MNKTAKISSVSFANEGLIFNVFEHSFDENCPISYSFPCRRSLREKKTTKKLAVNALHFYSHSALCAKYGQKNQSQIAQPCHYQDKMGEVSQNDNK